MICVRQYGDPGDPTIVLLHGGPGAQGSVASLARTMEGQCHVLEPLQRRGGDAPLSVDVHVRDLHEVILHCAIDQISLVGHSWGAMLALTYAARYPQQMERVVLIGCGTFDARSREAYHRNMQQRGDTASRERLRRLQAQLVSESQASARNELLNQIGHLSLLMQSVDVDPDALDAFAADERGHRETWADALRLQEDGTQPAEFARITAPVTMLHGTDDPHPGALIRDSLKAVIPHLAYHEFARCGHVPWLERQTRSPFLDTLRRVLSTPRT